MIGILYLLVFIASAIATVGWTLIGIENFSDRRVSRCMSANAFNWVLVVTFVLSALVTVANFLLSCAQIAYAWWFA